MWGKLKRAMKNHISQSNQNVQIAKKNKLQTLGKTKNGKKHENYKKINKYYRNTYTEERRRVSSREKYASTVKTENYQNESQ